MKITSLYDDKPRSIEFRGSAVKEQVNQEIPSILR